MSVRAARLAHSKVAETLESLRALIEHGDLPEARSVLAFLLDNFRTHEAAEAKLIAALERSRAS